MFQTLNQELRSREVRAVTCVAYEVLIVATTMICVIGRRKLW
jgi:hypothetical protein